jgi:uncharacterized protein YodC (DUF2158 family)
MANTFKAGDVVRLKSGGPKMTVVDPKSKDGASVYCAWWNGGDYKGTGFNAETLILVSAPAADE